jgi:hypothetical protein
MRLYRGIQSNDRVAHKREHVTYECCLYSNPERKAVKFVNAFAAKVEIMQQPIKERIAKLREEIAQIREANRLFLQGGSRSVVAAADQERRLQRLQAIMDELMSLTDWKKV